MCTIFFCAIHVKFWTMLMLFLHTLKVNDFLFNSTSFESHVGWGRSGWPNPLTNKSQIIEVHFLIPVKLIFRKASCQSFPTFVHLLSLQSIYSVTTWYMVVYSGLIWQFMHQGSILTRDVQMWVQHYNYFTEIIIYLIPRDPQHFILVILEHEYSAPVKLHTHGGMCGGSVLQR